jgi:beta-galactosidase/beta-glucuronidase
MRRTLTLLAALAAAVLAAAPAGAADTPSDRTLYESGPSGRYLVDGTWLFRPDPDPGNGLDQGFHRSASTEGWAQVRVPHAWNATDESVESFTGGVGWYRKDFELPSARRELTWILRFETVNYRMRAWLNGTPIGRNTGAYLPFELRIPASALRRTGTNRLVVRVDSRRLPTDFPPSGLSVTGAPTGGWWNYGGLLREVYLRRVDDVDFRYVQVRPELPCATCDARVSWEVALQNFGLRSRRVSVTGRLGARTVRLGMIALPARSTRIVRHAVTVRDPRLWSPDSPYLYEAGLTARSGDTTLQRFALKTGIRSVEVADGRLMLNGRPLNFRGFGLHEDSRTQGFAVDNAYRDRMLGLVKESGATLIRAHYPLHPYTQEQADRLGLMQWSEVPVYAVKTQYLKREIVRKLAARELESNILTNSNHPSIIVWSVGNELSSRPGPVQSDYLARAARAAKTLDPSRPVGYAVAGYPSAGCQRAYGPLDVIGVNEYFGWYPGPNGQIADRSTLPEYLDAVRACYPNKAVLVSEFGAEANREGPVEEKGTYLHQQDFVNYHSAVYASKPWLSGAIYWALQEFRVRPAWEGGNPRPTPPIHQKGVVDFDGNRKPAFFDLQRVFRSTQQLGAPPA